MTDNRDGNGIAPPCSSINAGEYIYINAFLVGLDVSKGRVHFDHYYFSEREELKRKEMSSQKCMMREASLGEMRKNRVCQRPLSK